jgi:general secretion pathway protein H
MTSATGSRSNVTRLPAGRRHPAAGFTLLELMVVLVLIGIILTFAVLSLRGDKVAEAMERESQRLATLISLANDEAVLRGEELAIRFTETGYEFLVFSAAGWQQRADDNLLRPRTLPPGMLVRVEVDGDPPGLQRPAEDDDEEDRKKEVITPQVFILSSGEMTPFSAIFEADQSRYRYHLGVSLFGESELEVEETL